MRQYTAALQSYFKGSTPNPRLPLDIRATAFQKQVWTHLQAIPRGSTQSYSEVAKAIGNPEAVRAVAQACANNPVALAIPCHRVVRRNGDPGGYRWGVRRKRGLLDLERNTARVGRRAAQLSR
jgi:AraC family transcriptional regulator, regulatory protein of adaptative response / methylated-DNA-[protein]-cysteine methyltransferase